MNKKKVGATALTLGVAAAVLLTGTYAYQSLNQEAMNEASGTVNPGGRLHDDFDYNNDVKRIYVENFGDQNIYARIKLTEYMELGTGAGVELTSTDARNIELVTTTSDYNDKATWQIHYYDSVNETDEYMTLDFGGDEVPYMPTFNKNKDSLQADINGTYDPNKDGDTSDRYSDYVDYSLAENATKSDYEIFDADTNIYDEFEDGTEVLDVTYTQSEEEVEHSVSQTLASCVMSMSDYSALEDGEKKTTECWVYDTDGWAYWSQPITPNTATGTLINDIDVKNVDDNWFYALNATAQFITADDLGKNDGTGFYDLDKGTEPTQEALDLLSSIGVDTGEVESNDTPNEVVLSDAAIALAQEIANKNVGESIRIESDLSSDIVTISEDYYVIAKEDNKALMMYYGSVGGGGKGLTYTFDETSNNWEDSSLRTTLNDTESGFLSDKSVLNELIMDTTLYTRDASNTDNYITTTDRVFIMSEADRLGTIQGVVISYTDSPNDYLTAPGDDGNIIPIDVNTDSDISMTGSTMMFEEDIMWLRTPGTNGTVRYATTRTSGSNGESAPSTSGIVFPMFWVDLSSATTTN